MFQIEMVFFPALLAHPPLPPPFPAIPTERGSLFCPGLPRRGLIFCHHGRGEESRVPFPPRRRPRVGEEGGEVLAHLAPDDRDEDGDDPRRHQLVSSIG